MSYPGGPPRADGPPYPAGPPPRGVAGPPYPGVPAAPVDPRSGLPLATYGQRVGAYLLDGLLMLALWVAVGIVVGLAGAIDESLATVLSAPAVIVLVGGPALVLIVGDGGALGQTPGKHLVGIKVVGPRPGPLGYGKAAIRWLGRMLDNIVCCLPIGLLWPLFDPERRTWHDMIADTRVVIAPPGERSLGYWWHHVRTGTGPAPARPDLYATGWHSPAGPHVRPAPGRGLAIIGVVGLVAVAAGGVAIVKAWGDSDPDGSAVLGEILDEPAAPPPTEAPPVTTAIGAEPEGGTSSSPAIGDANPSCVGGSDGTLAIGGLLPHTGDLSFLGPPAAAAAQVAVDEINAAGGVLGRDVLYLPGDSGDAEPDLANPALDAHLAEGADVILGAMGSGISFNVIDRIVGACKIQFSPGNTSAMFTDYADDDLYFRTAPSDTLQGQAVADLMIESGAATAAILARQDAYGEVLLESVRQPFEAQGGQVVVDLGYDPGAAAFDAEVSAVVGAAPDAIVVIGFDESARILDGLFAAGVNAGTTSIYLVDGNIGDYLGESISHPGALLGVRGTLPMAEITSDFAARMSGVDPSLVEFSYGPETYDAVIVTALATAAAGTDNPADVARQINGVTRDGESCGTFADCMALLDQGGDVDYDGVSGPLEFSRTGDPTIASFAILAYGPDNLIDEAATEHRLVQE
jgi:ABC-type branched-subunit amino acid transport system substrate-binding protein/uncharacterized RDD family membrane protein YckC